MPPTGESPSVGCSENQSPTPQELPPESVPNAMCGNPINAATGNKLQIETDFVGGAQTGLEFIRYYNSQDTAVTALGARWRTTWQRSLNVSGTTVTVIRVHHATILEMNVDSYRRKEAIDKARGVGRPATRATIKASA